MHGKTVAVLLSVYNGEQFLREQIESVLAQTHHDLVFYIRDDGSRDASVSIIREYAAKDKRIVFLEDGKNLGYPECFHVLTRRPLSEDMIMFCDQDDIWYPHKIQYALERMAGHEEEVAAYYAAYDLGDGDGNVVGHFPHRKEPFTLENTMFEVCGLEFTMAINQKALQFLQEHWPPKTHARGTWMSPVFAAFGTIQFDDRAVALYRRHETAVTSDNMSFFGLWRWRIRQLIQGEFSFYSGLLEDFETMFSEKLPREEQRFLHLFASKKGLSARIRKACYPKRLRSRWSDELGLRAAFLFGKL